MANKNDLRYVKTEELIKTTYRDLCLSKRKTPSVASLCAQARINKTTFYMHYENMEILQREYGKEAIHELMKDIPDLNRLFFDVEHFALSLIRIFTENFSETRVLFSTEDELVDAVEKEILAIYIHPETQPLMALKVRFCVGGALRLFSYSVDQYTVKTAIELLKGILES